MRGIALIKIYSICKRDQINSIWRISKLDNLVCYKEILFRKAKRFKPKLFQGLNDLGCVFRRDLNPNIQILGVARTTVKRDRIAPHYKVFDIVIV